MIGLECITLAKVFCNFSKYLIYTVTFVSRIAIAASMVQVTMYSIIDSKLLCRVVFYNNKT